MDTVAEPVNRNFPRVAIPAGLRGERVESQAVELLEVSPEAVRIGHEIELEGGALCTLILPSATEALQLPARIMWTHSWESSERQTGKRRFHHESRLIFLRPIPAPQIPLAYSFLKGFADGSESKKPGMKDRQPSGRVASHA